MKVEGILKEKGYGVFTIHEDAVIADVLRLLAEKRIGALIVVDASGAIRGIVSERDIIHQGHESQGNVKGLPVNRVMTPRENLIVSSPEDDIEYLMEVMTEKRIRHIPIVNREGELRGIISVGDVVKALLTHKDHEIKYLRDYIEGKYPA